MSGSGREELSKYYCDCNICLQGILNIFWTALVGKMHFLEKLITRSLWFRIVSVTSVSLKYWKKCTVWGSMQFVGFLKNLSRNLYEVDCSWCFLLRYKCIHLEAGLEELKIWVHVFSCTPMQVCVHVVHAANFVHVNYLCVHACTWLYTLRKYFSRVVLCYLILH